MNNNKRVLITVIENGFIFEAFLQGEQKAIFVPTKAKLTKLYKQWLEELSDYSAA